MDSRRDARAAARDRHDAYEIMLSESQERMLLVVERGREHEVEAVFEKWDLHAVQGRRRHRRHALARSTTRHARRRRADSRAHRRSAGLSPADGSAVWQKSVQQLVVRRSGAGAVGAAGVRRAARVADDRQQALGLPPVRPHGRHQHHRAARHAAGVVRVKGTPRGLAVSVDGNGRFCYLDPVSGRDAGRGRGGAQRRLRRRRADRRHQQPELRQSRTARDHVADRARPSAASATPAGRSNMPITGGNVSLYNETEGRAIFPTPVLGVVGLLEDASKTVDARVQDGRCRGGAAGR